MTSSVKIGKKGERERERERTGGRSGRSEGERGKESEGEREREREREGGGEDRLPPCSVLHLPVFFTPRHQLRPFSNNVCSSRYVSTPVPGCSTGGKRSSRVTSPMSFNICAGDGNGSRLASLPIRCGPAASRAALTVSKSSTMTTGGSSSES